jgi:hypothetical protein
MKRGNEIPLGDGPCGDCGQDNPFIWWTDNVFWNAVMRAPDSEPEPFLCLTCFVKRAYAKYDLRGFYVKPDWRWVEMSSDH